jgi:hypothetical protein
MDVCFDIDGTLADCEHRRHWITTRPKNHKAFYLGIPHDPPIAPICETFQRLFTAGCRIVCCTGRPEWTRDMTNDWLRKHNVWPRRVYMRPDNDFRDDAIIKAELLVKIREDGFDPTLVFDDRQRVVDMWRENGIVCAQVAPGNF